MLGRCPGGQARSTSWFRTSWRVFSRSCSEVSIWCQKFTRVLIESNFYNTILNLEEIQVVTRVSKSHCFMIVRPHKIFLTLRKTLRFVCTNWKFMNFNLFYSFFLQVSHILIGFSDIFALFLLQNFKTKGLTAQKNLLLECLLVTKKLLSISLFWYFCH